MLQLFFGLCTLVTTPVLGVSVLLALIVATGTPEAWPLALFLVLASGLAWWTSVAHLRRLRTPFRLHLAWTILWTVGAIPPMNVYVLGSYQLFAAWIRTLVTGTPTKVYPPKPLGEDPAPWIASAICIAIASIAFFGGGRFHRWWKQQPESKPKSGIRRGIPRHG